MRPVPEKVAALRHLLAERFSCTTRPMGRSLPTGIPALDEIAGGLPLSAITEIVSAAPGCGGTLLAGQLLALTRAARTRMALVDTNAFDPGSFSDETLMHLVWARCRTTAEALQVADLLARDANLGLVLLDLRMASAAELRRTPSSFWYRLQRAVESTDLALVIQTAAICISSAQLRITLPASHPLDALSQERASLITQLAPVLQRQRRATATG